MADIDITAAPRRLLVDGRDPLTDEVIAVSDPSILSVAAPDSNGQTFVTGVADGAYSITVQPNAEEAAALRTTGTLSGSVGTPTPLVVTFA